MAAKQTIGSSIKIAQDYEEKKQEREAYGYYLYAVQQIVAQLQHVSPQDSTSSCGVPPIQLLGLATSCLESAGRLLHLATDEKREFTTVHLQSMPATITNMTHQQPKRAMSSDGVHTMPCPLRSQSDVGGNRPLRRKPQVAKIQSPGQQQSLQLGPIQPLHRISPMDEARKKNMYLMKQYQSNLRKDSVKMLGTPRQNITLNYLRRMEENKSVARINEQVLVRKSKKREARLKQEHQKVKMTTFRKSMDSLSLEDLAQEVTSFEQGKTNYQALKQKLSGSPDSTDIVNELVVEVLNCSDHPLSKLMGECQYSVTQFLQPLVKKIECSGRLPYCILKKDSTVACLYATLSESCDQLSCDQSDGPTPKPSLDQKLLMLKNELMSDEEGDGNKQEEEDDLELFSLQCVDTEGEREEEGEREGELSTLREYTDETVKGVEPRMVEFRGLMSVKCDPQYGVNSTFTALAKECSDYLGGACKLVHSAINKMVNSFAMIYPEVSIDDNIDECRNVIEDYYFPVIMPLLFPIYRCTNYSTECTILRNMTDHYNDTPKEGGVRRKFWLEDQDSAPYANAIGIILELCTLRTPRAKLSHLVTFSKSIIQSIEEYYSTSDSKVDTGVGVDDILPIMTYVIIKSARPELVSECSFMQEFIQECYSMGEDGFCLTSFDTAVRFVTQMNS